MKGISCFASINIIKTDMIEQIRPRVSVAMAVYNGEKYINEQIDSILNQLCDEDELVISYNKSTDSTWEIIKEYEKNDKRVKCLFCSSNGFVSNFNNAILNTNGDIIFLADQDDVWNEKKIECVLRVFMEKDVIMVMHNYEQIDASGGIIPGDLFARRNARSGLIKNFIKNCYQGCCMAFKRELVRMICPIPVEVAMHDQWIGLCAEYVGSTEFVNRNLISYRRHNNNVTANRLNMYDKIKYRWVLLINLIKRKRYMKKV